MDTHLVLKRLAKIQQDAATIQLFILSRTVITSVDKAVVYDEIDELKWQFNYLLKDLDKAELK
jgi:hypothetical protein